VTRKTILKFGAVENAEAGDLVGRVGVEGNQTIRRRKRRIDLAGHRQSL
jgi:hypothetical protein